MGSMLKTGGILYLKASLQWLRVDYLTQAELNRIDEVAPKDIAAGDRYPDMSSVNASQNRANYCGTLS